MNFHLIGFPHTVINTSYGQCAYTQKIRKFRLMFPESILYANEGSDGEFVQIFSEKDRVDRFGHLGKEYYKAEWGGKHWEEFNMIVIEEVKKRIQPQDIILSLGGISQKSIADAFPHNLFVEFGIGYEGIFSSFLVFESYAWMHNIYGLLGEKDGRFYDAVIPNYFDPSEFPFSAKKDDYLLFMSRPIERKGIEIVREIAKRNRVIVTGAEKTDFGEWVGYADSKKRGELMSHAKALLCPTLYIEPFGGVVVEAAMCGTPSITTDWGAFTETVVDGVTGFRCRTLGEFLGAVKKVESLSPSVIESRAMDLYSLDAVKKKYEAYFTRLQTLYGKGWYTL